MKTSIHIASAKHALRAHMGWHAGKRTRLWHGLPSSILGVGFGIKRTNGEAVARDCLRVYVRKKLANRALKSRDRIPDTIEGVPVDVVEIGKIRVHAGPGGSIGNGRHVNGTLGCIVKDESARYLLGSWHVLTGPDGRDGDPVYMPSLDVNSNAPIVGTLIATPQFHLNGGANAFDASVAKLSDGVVIEPALEAFGQIAPTLANVDHGPVVKIGATTGQTHGHIDGVSEDFPIVYFNEAANRAVLTRQIAILGDDGAFSDEGDSGALVCTPELEPVGIIVGGGVRNGFGSQVHTFASPIRPILQFYEVEIAT